MARRRYNRTFRAAAGLLGATALTGAALNLSLSAATAAPAPIPSAASSPVAATAWSLDPTTAAAPPDRATTSPPVPATTSSRKPATATSSPIPATTSSSVAPEMPAVPEPLPCAARTLNVVAHEDDDLLFINPSVSNDIAAGRCVVTLFVTAGDSGRPGSYWLRREQGSMAAYAAMAGTPPTWESDTITLAGHPITRQRLVGSRITLLFLRLPDAHGNPARPAGTLQQLWSGDVHTMRPLGPGPAFTKLTLTKTLTAAMVAYHPDRIRTLDYAGHYGDGDHADHHTVGYFTLAARTGYHTRHTLSGYRGYTVAAYPDNLDPTTATLKLGYFLAYAPYDSKVCQTAATCQSNFYGPRFTHSLTTATSAR